MKRVVVDHFGGPDVFTPGYELGPGCAHELLDSTAAKGQVVLVPGTRGDGDVGSE